jgi:uncharacterized protein YbaR (Trm112 family)
MPLDKELIDILCCPVTKTPVRLLTKDEIDKLNDRIGSEQLRYADGELVDKALQEGLITEDGKTVYRVDDGIPVMLADKGIALADA